MALTSASTSGGYLIRDEVWSQIIQDELEQQLFAQNLIMWLTDEFPDGDLLTIPTLSSLAAMDYVENTDIAIQDPTVAEFQLTIDSYLQSGIAVTDKMKQDTYYINTINSIFPAKMVRALMERLENDIFLLHKKQTNNDANTINGYAHRYVGGGASNAITLDDVAKAKLALDKANVSKMDRIAVVDPKVSYQLVNIDNVIRQDVYGANAALKEGFGSSNYIGRYLGFDFYESNMIDEATALDYVTGGSLKGNLFLGYEALVGAIRTMPSIEFYRDTIKQRDVYTCNIRYGLGLYRPESLVCVLTG